MNREKLRADLQRDEGWRELAYDDATGKTVCKGDTLQGFVSVGWGFCLDGDRGAPLPMIVAEIWLDHLIREKTNQFRARWPAFDDQPEEVQRALGNMIYQMGVSGLLNFRRMLAALERGDRAGAARHALDSRWAVQTPNRARRIANLIRGGNEPVSDR